MFSNLNAKIRGCNSDYNVHFNNFPNNRHNKSLIKYFNSKKQALLRYIINNSDLFNYDDTAPPKSDEFRQKLKQLFPFMSNHQYECIITNILFGIKHHNISFNFTENGMAISVDIYSLKLDYVPKLCLELFYSKTHDAKTFERALLRAKANDTAERHANIRKHTARILPQPLYLTLKLYIDWE